MDAVFLLDTLGDLQDRDLVLIDLAPDGIGAMYSRLIRGRTIAADFPASAVLRMSLDRTGLKLATMIGNTKRYLILHRDAKEIVAAEHARHGGRGSIEYLPF